MKTRVGLIGINQTIIPILMWIYTNVSDIVYIIHIRSLFILSLIIYIISYIKP